MFKKIEYFILILILIIAILILMYIKKNTINEDFVCGLAEVLVITGDQCQKPD